MSAISKSIYEKFIIESADGSRNVDISAGVIAFTYFENIFSPTLTARAIVVNTGNTVRGEDGIMQTVYNGLPIRGGERVLIKIADQDPPKIAPVYIAPRTISPDEGSSANVKGTRMATAIVAESPTQYTVHGD